MSDSTFSLGPSGASTEHGRIEWEGESPMPRLQDVKDDVIYLRSAGVDLGKRFLLACVRTPSEHRAGSWALETERFGTTPSKSGACLPGWCNGRWKWW
ncbi:hypothetical protein ABZT45_51030 [Streptomyces sp. NPDC005356]|uniref:hypothetical protein n=1 Tax=unclassified Streptomyces TaxID=2593676 RepID=UPI0033B21E52